MPGMEEKSFTKAKKLMLDKFPKYAIISLVPNMEA
jgi:hypothetical protein